MDRITKTVISDKTIFTIDYSGLKDRDMILLVSRLTELVRSVNEPVYILSLYGKNYVTPSFMRHVEKVSLEVVDLIKGQAITGLTPTQEWILKGYNLFLGKSYKSFPTKEEALKSFFA